MAICLQRLLGWQVEPCDAAKFRQVTKDFKIVTQTKQVHEIMKQAMACKQSGDEAGYKKLKGQASVLKSNLPALVFSCQVGKGDAHEPQRSVIFP